MVFLIDSVHEIDISLYGLGPDGITRRAGDKNRSLALINLVAFKPRLKMPTIRPTSH